MRVFGQIPGVALGAEFVDRRSLYEAGVHRALQAGIVGGGSEGAESIVVSGGYEDDEDYGDVLIYTGQGGKDPATKDQVADQKFVRGNRALAVNADEGIPVRVVRGVGGDPAFSPADGYRYDGLFTVESYWSDVGQSGFRVWRYRLVAVDDPVPDAGAKDDAAVLPSRIETTVQRIVRNTKVSSAVKALNGHRCQVCGEIVETPAGPYAEGAHIRPLGRPHDGPDVPGNVLCLCPNDHVRFDRGSVWIDDTFNIIDTASGTSLGRLRLAPGHHVDPVAVAYHRDLWR